MVVRNARKRLLAFLLAAILSVWSIPAAFADEQSSVQQDMEAVEANDSLQVYEADNEDREGQLPQNETEPVAIAGAAGDVPSERSVIGGSYVYQVDYELTTNSTVVKVSLPSVSELIASGKADKVVIEANMNYGNAITRAVSCEYFLADVEAMGGSFELDFADYGKFTAVAKFFKNGSLVQTGDSQTVGITADEYNIAPVSATLPVTFFSLSLWGEDSIRYNEEGATVPTIVLLERPNAFNWENLPEGVYGLPYLSKSEISYQPSDFDDASNLFRDRSWAMADYVADLYELNPSSEFNLYCVDFYLGLIQTVLYANGIPQDQYSITVLSDGSWSYSEFTWVYDGANPSVKHESMKAQWNQAKNSAYDTGQASSGFSLSGPREMVYAAIDSEPNAQWWLARPALLETKGDGNAFGKLAQADTEQVIRIYIDKKLAALQDEGESAIAEFKALYNFSDSYFADAEAKGKDVMLFLGTTVGNEAGSFADYAKFAMTLYGDQYEYYYKGHPGSPTDFYPEKQQELVNLGIKDVDSSVAAELILFFYPEVYMSGYTSSTYASVSNPDQAKGLFRITKSAALADVTADYSIMDWFISPIDDSSDSAILALCKGGANYLVEFSDEYLSAVDYDIAIWNASTSTITYYRAENGSYTFVSSNKPQPAEGAWVQSGGRWWYEYSDRTYPRNEMVFIGNDTYAFDSDGWMITGWTTAVDGQWRFFNESGAMQTGWLWSGGAWYYLDPSSGIMQSSWFKADDGGWYYSNESGAMQTGWLWSGGAWYYLSSSGRMAIDWVYIDGEWYYFNESGAMQTGWFTASNGTWYYANSSGVMQTGWIHSNGAWYYLMGSGAMAKGWCYVGNEWYYLNDSGAMQTGWIQLDDTWYYLYGNGIMARDSWIGNYYLLATGAMATDAWVGPFYVNSDGSWVPGAVR